MDKSTTVSQEVELETLISQRSQSTQISPEKSRFTGWRFSVVCGAILATLVFIANTTLLIWASVHFSVEDNIVTLFEGSCDTMETVFTWTHFGINILSTLLLSASNACMQCLAAPTRAEVDQQHSQGKWLDIGVMSLRNLWAISRWRLTLWCCLALSSIPLHLLYNSVVFSTLSANEYLVMLAAPNFQSGAAWNTSDFLGSSDFLVGIQKEAATWKNLSNSACLEIYSQSYIHDYRNLVVVLNATNTTNTFLKLIFEDSIDDQYWYCSESPCNIQKLKLDAASWTFTVDSWPDQTFKVDYCLAEPSTPACKVQLGLVMFIVVIISNAVKVVCILITVFKSDFQPLITTGDALASFLSLPDETTAEYPQLTAHDVRTFKRFQETSYKSTPELKPFQSAIRYRWFTAASVLRWTIAGALFLITWFVALGMLILAIKGNSPTIWSAGLGAVDHSNIIHVVSNISIGSAALLSNTPQIIVSFLYIMYNNLFTCMLSAAEVSSFADAPKALRVSQPVGQQRSTYWLSLPHRYAISLMILIGSLHWLISQSIFLARIDVSDMHGNADPDAGISACGWSAKGLVASLAMGGTMIIVLSGFGLRKFKAGIPVMSNCSIALSSACHPLSSDVGLESKPIMYGVLKEKDQNGPEKLGFGTDVVRPLVNIY